MLSPNSYMLSEEGEGIRVYYVMAYHAKHDSNYVNFEGMNYPYGEHIIYCDAQPLVANGFKWFVNLFPGAADYAVGTQNVISLYGLILASILYFFLFRRWKMPPWYSAAVAIVMMLFAPQILRMPWQPGPSYAFVMPIFILLYQSYYRNRSWKISGIICFTGLIAYLINPYFGVIATAFYALIHVFISKKPDWKQFSFYIKGFVTSLLPGILYQFWGAFTDFRTDRVQLPDGLHQFTATLSTIFTSPYTPAAAFYEAIGVDMDNIWEHFEGLSYIGLFSILIILFFVVRRIYGKATKTTFEQFLTNEQKALIPAIIILLLLAMGVPFILHHSFEEMLSLFKPLRQLRAYGRFAWIATILIDLLSFYLIYRWYESTENKKLQPIILGVIISGLLFTSVEGVYMHQEARKHQYAGNTLIESGIQQDSTLAHLAPLINEISSEDYQAIVPIPYFHVGSELFVTGTHTTYQAMLEALSFSYHVNIPVTACYLSRISRKESSRSFQFFAPTSIKKEIAEDYTSEKPLLLFYSKFIQSISKDEERLLKLGTTIFENDQLLLVSIPPSEIWSTETGPKHSWYTEYTQLYTSTSELHYFGKIPPIYLNYDNEYQISSFMGDGALYQEPGTVEYLFDQKRDASNATLGKYELSFWLETSLNRPQSNLMVEITDHSGKVLSTETLYEAKRSFGHLNGWVRWQHEVELRDDQYIRLWIKEPTDRPGILIDEVMLLPEKSSVFVPVNHETWTWNNFPFDIGD